MVLEPFFLVTWLLLFLGQKIASYGYYMSGWALSAFMIYLNLKLIFIPAIRNYFTVEDVESLTYKYYQTTKLHRDYRHPVIQAFAGPKVDWIISKLTLKNKSILDVGGGNGYFSQFFMKYCSDTHVLDISAEQLNMNPLPESKRHLGSAYNLVIKSFLLHKRHPSQAHNKIKHQGNSLLTKQTY